MDNAPIVISPYPPRFRWTKRIAKVYAVIVFLLILTRIAWGNLADAKLNAKLAELDAAGANVYPEKLIRPRFDDESNPGFEFKRPLI